MERTITVKRKGMLAALRGELKYIDVIKPNPEYVNMLQRRVDAGWAELEGSDKQISWAMDIRKSGIEELKKAIQTNENWFANDGSVRYEDLDAFIDWLKGINRASWWIETRGMLMVIGLERFQLGRK